MKFSILLKLIFLFTGYLLLKMCHLIFSTIWFVTHYSCVTHRFDPVSIRPSRDIRPYVTRLLSPYTGLVLARGTILSRYVSDQEIVVWRTKELLPTRLNLDIFSLCKKRKRIENWKIIYLTLIFLQSLYFNSSTDLENQTSDFQRWLKYSFSLQCLFIMKTTGDENWHAHQ